MRKLTQLALLVICLAAGNAGIAQTVITQWNFNSNPADANTSTGTITPSTGSGTISAIGGVTASFASGASNGGSSDPAPSADNSGWGITGFPAQSTANKTAGIQFAVSTAGRTNIVVTFDLRHSNTSARHEQFQYTTDISAATPVWVDFASDAGSAGDTWFARSYDLSAIAAINNNPNAGFRVVSLYEPATTAYTASNTGSNYAASGTWRFDMVTVKENATLVPANVSFVGSNATVNETTTSIDIIANLTGGNSSASSVAIEVLPVSTATTGSDFTLPASLVYDWAPNSNNVKDTITITINNDVLPENAEYFIVRFVNPVNVTLPAASSNHYTVFIADDDKAAPVASNLIQLNHIASFSNGAAGANSAEIVAHDPGTQRLFIANSVGAKIDIVNFSNPAAASLITSIPVTTYGNINSIAVKNGIVAAAIENTNPQLPGKVVFFNTSGTYVNQVEVGVMPDMITFNHAGTKILTANEGEPNAAYTSDPEGSVSIIDVTGGIAGLTQANVTNVGFTSFNAQAATLRAAGIRIFGPSATVAQDLEPEYITISEDDQTAYVACQENNAIAVLDLNTNAFTNIRSLGSKDHMISANALDASDQAASVQIANWPVKGFYMPDAIASFVSGGQTYIVTANEGDSREYTGYSEIVRLSSSSYVLDPTAFPYADALKANIGRLNVTTASGDTDNDGDFDEIYVYGGRSFSIWNAATGALVWDSGQDFESITSKHPTLSAIFNASNSNNTFKNRSDDKGPEPEGIAIGQIAGKTFAFIALERIGGCMVYDITNPASPVFVDYKNTRTIASYGGDNGAEGIIYISAANSPTGNPMVILANEVSSTLTFFSVDIAALNITLADIAVVNDGAKNKLTWKTANEAKGDVFELEISKDGRFFSYVTSVQANGHASTYNYTDEQPYDGWNYYRLKFKHTTAAVAYSKVVSAYVKTDEKPMVKVFPNPGHNYISVQLTKAPASGVVELIDAQGKVLLSKSINATANRIDISGLPAGIYTLRYSDGDIKEIITISKQ